MDEPTYYLLLGVGIVLLLVLANGFFVAVEFALVRTHPTKLKSPEVKGKLGIASSLRLIETLDLSLSATQVGITIASLLLGWWGELTFQHIFIKLFHFLGEPTAWIASHAAATTCALVVITYLHVVLGELVCKSLAIRYPETVLRFLAGPMVLFTIFCRPLIRLLNDSATLFLWLLGIRTPAESERVHSLAELAMLVSQSTERGVIDKTEEEMLHGIFNFSETVAREVMTPRRDLVTIPVDASLEEVLDIAVESGLSRYPVIGETIDDVPGFLLVKDLFPYLHAKGVQAEREFSVRRVMREPFFVPSTKPIDDLLNEFKRRKIHMAVVLDEHGGVDGVVTLEDLLEEIVGDIFDESDETKRSIVPQDDNEWLVDGGVLVADINSQLEFEIPEGDYDTVAGFIYTTLGRIPRSGDEIELCKGGDLVVHRAPRDDKPVVTQIIHANGQALGEDEVEPEVVPLASIRVERVQGRRVETVRLRKLAVDEIPEPDEPPVSSQAKG